MEGKCPNCKADLRYVKSIKSLLCNDCGFNAKYEPFDIDAIKPTDSLKSRSPEKCPACNNDLDLLTTGKKICKKCGIINQHFYDNLSKPHLPSSPANSSLSKAPLPSPSSATLSNSKSFVTILNSGEIRISSQTIPEAKIAIKELKLKKKEYTLEKKGVIQKQKEIRANYTDAMRRRSAPSTHFFPRREIRVRDDARRDLAKALQPLEQQKNSIETKISLIDQAILHLEKFIAGLQ
jgi:transcription initiation factor TFIIIB Brf1 subunit/transcription initiation factor TFIIB